MTDTVKMYTLSTCSHCKAAKKFMEDYAVVHEFIDVDLLTGQERNSALDEIRKYNPACSFPTILIGDTVIIGFNESAIREALGLVSAVEKLYDMLRKTQAPKGYHFNRDRERVFDLLAALLVNRERYGYMCCPCRLASGDRDWDRDIICPCAYREADIRQYGSCYCNLYVTPAWNEGKIPVDYVPERRPPEKMRA